MKDWTEADYWLALAVLLCATVVALALTVRLTSDGPNASVECVKAGGTWNDFAAGHCERGGK